MKTKPHTTFGLRSWSFNAIWAALLAVFTLFTAAPGALAQSDTVTISAADFQRLVYTAHLHTQLALKPELEASLQVLLEMQRRNPNASPAALADLSRQALQLYRTKAPASIRTNGFRDEILAAYLDALRQVPAHTNFVPINLTMLHNFMLGTNDYDPSVPVGNQISSLVNAGNQRLFSSEGEAIKRQALVDNCVARAHADPAFATALDRLLSPETLVSLGDTSAEIIGNTNSPLHNNLTMQTLLALSQASGNGSLTVSTNQVMDLLTNEVQTIWDTIHTNLAVLAQVNQNQPDLLAYLTNQAAIDANVQLWAAVQQGQPARLACATAAVLVQSKLLPVNTDSADAEQVGSALGGLAIGIGSLCLGDPGGLESVLSGGLDIFNMFSGDQSPQDVMANQISNIQTMVGDLSTNMNYRFDRVDQSLTTIFDTLSNQFSKIDITLDAQGRQIAQLNGSVDDIRSSLVDVQAGLDRIEQDIFLGFATSERDQYLIGPANAALFYEAQNPGKTMTWTEYAMTPNYENDFYSYAASYAADNNLCPSVSLDLAGADLAQQLAARPLDANLNYVAQFISSNLVQQTLGSTPLANPQEWFMGAYAYLQLAGENPMLFREKGLRVPAIISRGQNLTNFLGSLTFSGPNINWPLYNALEGYYATNLVSVYGQVSNTEYQYAFENNFALGTWRQWDLAAPRVTATGTAVLFAPSIPSIIIARESATKIAAGAYHSLALKSDGTVVGWGANDYGQSTIPFGLSNAVAIAAGADYSLALRADGTVVGWRGNEDGQTSIPAGLSNVAAIAAGADHSLALQSNGTVVAWGDNSFGETNVPPGLTNVVAIAAGADHSLALTSGGTVVGWGAGSPGSAGYGLSFDGVDDVATVTNQAALNAYPLTISAWINTTQTNGGIVNKYLSSSYNGYQLFLDSGHIHAWYFEGGNASIYRGVFAGGNGLDGGVVADGRWHQVAFVVDGNGGRLFVDGILTASMPWTGAPGATTTSQPLALGNYPGNSSRNDFYSGLLDEVRIWNVARSQADLQADMMHRLTGTEPGLIAYWKLDDGTGATATNSAVATGSACDGALNGPTWVPGWGEFGQATIPPDTTNVMAIAAGAWHSLALQSNGTVVAWGLDDHGQCDWPPGLTNVVAIAAGYQHSLALKADGTVVAWGDNSYGQTNIPFGLSNVVAIAAGADHSLALKADGTVVAWGKINERQCLVPPALTWRGAIAAAADHSLALKADGTVIGWGDNTYRQTSIPAGLTNVVAIAAGETYSLALKADGTVVGWGDNTYRQTSIPAGLTDVVAIAAGEFYSLALKADGTVVGWGDNSSGQTNIPAGLTNVVAITAGAYHSLALTVEGTVVGWGDNTYRQTSIPAGLTNVVAIAAGEFYSLALQADGTVIGWGDNRHGQTNIPAGLTNVVAITAGAYHSLALTVEGTVVAWGDNTYGQTNIPADLTNVVAIAAGETYSLALKADGTLGGWGFDLNGQVNILPGWTNVVAIAAGYSHSLALRADGTVAGWGFSYFGEANPPPGLSNVVAIAAGDTHSLALNADGTVVGWGDNDDGETTIPAGLNNVVAIAAGSLHSLALRGDGTVVGWGNNDWGETDIPAGLNNVVAIAAGEGNSLALQADGTVVGWGTYSPIVPSGLSDVVAIAVGEFSCLALQADGTVIGWGADNTGQTDIPAGLTNVVAIAAGWSSSLALQADGTVISWGSFSPTVPPGLSNGVAIAAGNGYGLFLTATLTGGSGGSGGLSFIKAEIPDRVGALFYSCNTNTIYQMGLAGPLHTAAVELSGAKALLTAVLELGMPYTLERDGVLHGFLYGSESLMDNDNASAFVQAENAQLQASRNAPPQLFTDVAALRYECFANRLHQCLTNLQATGQPEIPRLVGHTLRLLSLLSDAYTPVPPPALELSSVSNSPSLLLYGEPYVRYTLQYRDALSVPGWTTTTITNLQDQQTITPPLSAGPQRFYRAMLPVP